jgi:hypothetical protein
LVISTSDIGENDLDTDSGKSDRDGAGDEKKARITCSDAALLAMVSVSKNICVSKQMQPAQPNETIWEICAFLEVMFTYENSFKQ